MPFVRQGTCNLCGQCCGALSSPNSSNPWPRYWPQAMRNFTWEDFVTAMPHAEALGAKPTPDGKVDLSGLKLSGNLNVGGHVIKFKIISGEGVVRVTQGQNYCKECPFLLPDPGDGTRPCALVGTMYESWWTEVCDEGPADGRVGVPPFVIETQEEVDEWFWRHPDCSFEYIEQ